MATTKREQIETTLELLKQLLIATLEDPTLVPITKDDEARDRLQQMIISLNRQTTNNIIHDCQVRDFIDGAVRLEVFAHQMVIIAENPELYTRIVESVKELKNPRPKNDVLTPAEMELLPTIGEVM